MAGKPFSAIYLPTIPLYAPGIIMHPEESNFLNVEQLFLKSIKLIVILNLNKNIICDVILLELGNNHLLNWELSKLLYTILI